MGIIPEAPSFGTQLARGLGAGVSSGLDTATQLSLSAMLERAKIAQRQKLIQSIEDSNDFSKFGANSDHAVNEGDTAAKLQGTEDSFAKAKKYAAAGEHELARLETEKAKVNEKRSIAREQREFLPKEEYIKHAAKQNTTYLDEISQVERDMPNTEFSLAMVEDALGDAGKWSAAKDWLADHTKFAGFKSSSGAELDSAIKNYFLGDLSSIKGGRINQFLEKQVRDAYPKAGQDPISNQKILLGMRLKEKINNLKIEKTRELEEHFLQKDGYLPAGFKSMVNKSIKPAVEKIEKDAINTLHAMSKIEQDRDKIFRSYLSPGETLMMDPEGNPFAVKKSEVSMYREQGYIPLGKK